MSHAPAWLITLASLITLINTLIFFSPLNLLTQTLLLLPIITHPQTLYKTPWEKESTLALIPQALLIIIVFVQVGYSLGLGISTLYDIPLPHLWGLLTGLCFFGTYRALNDESNWTEMLLLTFGAILVFSLALILVDFVSQGFFFSTFPKVKTILLWTIFILAGGLVFLGLAIANTDLYTRIHSPALIGLHTLAWGGIWLFYPPHDLTALSLMMTTGFTTGLARVLWKNDWFGKTLIQYCVPKLTKTDSDKLLDQALIHLSQSDLQNEDNTYALHITAPKEWMWKSSIALEGLDHKTGHYTIISAISKKIKVEGISPVNITSTGKLPTSAHEKIALMKRAWSG